MYMPDPVLAKQCLDCGSLGRLLRFTVYSLDLHQPPDDPYNEVAKELKKEGSNRNIFLVDDHDNPIWRIADYEQYGLADMFVHIRSTEEAATAIGITANGHIFEINLADGSLKKIGWNK